jgi:hypothetical protein
MNGGNARIVSSKTNLVKINALLAKLFLDRFPGNMCFASRDHRLMYVQPVN